MTERILSTLMVVDDVPRNVQIVGNVLVDAGYEVILCIGPEEALESLETQRPELILLDVRMPGMDGFELLARIRRDADLDDVPVIFLTAATELESIVRGFREGAVDYVTKPFQAEELLARVRTHIELRAARRALRDANARLVALDRERTEFVAMAAHDLRSPLNVCALYGELLGDAIAPDDVTARGYVTQLTKSVKDMSYLIGKFLDAQAAEDGLPLQLERVDAARLVDELFVRYRPVCQKKGVIARLEADSPIPLQTDRTLFLRCVENLLSNAIKFSPVGAELAIRVERVGERVRVEVDDQGPGITEHDRAKLFSKYGRLAAKPTGDEPSTGLGLFTVKRLIGRLGGEVGCRSEVGRGSTFFLELELLAGCSSPPVAPRGAGTR